MTPKWEIDSVEFYLPEQAEELITQETSYYNWLKTGNPASKENWQTAKETGLKALDMLQRQEISNPSANDVISGVLFYYWDQKFLSPDYAEAVLAAHKFNCTKAIIVPYRKSDESRLIAQ